MGKHKNKAWRYLLLADYRVYIPEFAYKLTRHYDSKWFTLHSSGALIIRRGYGWDGASCVPDGGKLELVPEKLRVFCNRPGDCVRTTTPGTVVHDCLYQFLDEISRVLELKPSYVRKAADKYFRYSIRLHGFRFWRTYYAGVRLFGGIHRWLQGRK